MMVTINRAYASGRYGQLHYRIILPETATNALPLLCLHQTPSNSQDWVPVMPALGRNRIVIAVDTPGYGMSDPPPAPVRIEDLAGVMAQFMIDLANTGVLRGGVFDVMGYHTGAVIAAELARAFPRRVRHLVLFGLAAFPSEGRAEMLARLRESFPVPDGGLRHVEKLWNFIAMFFDSRISAEDRHIHMAECLRIGVRMPWAYISVFNYDFLAVLAELDKPALIFNPQDDLWDVTREVSHLLRNGTRYDIPGVAHGVLAIEHDRVVGEIERFLA